MPCRDYSDNVDPDHSLRQHLRGEKEKHRYRLMHLYNEVFDATEFDSDAYKEGSRPDICYSLSNDQLAAAMCAEIRSWPSSEVKERSLELQIWWRDHKIADAERERAEREAREKQLKREAALAKLSDEDREILGV